jgi:hypothetical protein
VAAGLLGAPSDDQFERGTDPLDVEPDLGQSLFGRVLAAPGDADEQVFGADVVVPEPAGLLLGPERWPVARRP